MKITQNPSYAIGIICISFGLSAIKPATANPSETTPEGRLTGYIITAGGTSGNVDIKNSYVLNLSSREWSALPDLQQPSSRLAMVLNSGKVYAIGGMRNGSWGDGSQNGTYSNATSYLSTVDNAWITSSPVKNNYGTSAAVSLNNSIYVVGSRNSPWTQLQVQGIDGVWSNLPFASLNHFGSAAAILNGNIYVCDGLFGKSNLCEFYNPTNQTWTTLPKMSLRRSSPRVVGLNGYLYVIGGTEGLNERYDPATSQWTFFKTTTTNPLYSSAAVTDGKYIYIIGGDTYSTSDARYDGSRNTDTVEMYNPELDTWQSLPKYPIAASLIGAVYVDKMPDS